mgnify:CR=1 FL=1
MSKEVYTVSQALDKAMKYCAYQERCHSEVRQRLNGFNLTEDERDQVIFELIQEGFLSEERYSRAFVRGKFRMKQWGRKKIILALRQKQVSESCIQLGLNEIEDQEYNATLIQLIEKSIEKHKSLQPYQRKAKTAQNMIGKGFEAELVWDNLNTIIND